MIKVFKLITSEEIIAKVDSHDDQYWNLINPKIISKGINSEGAYTTYLANYIICYGEDIVSIKTNHVIAHGNPTKESEEFYINSDKPDDIIMDSDTIH